MQWHVDFTLVRAPTCINTHASHTRMRVFPKPSCHAPLRQVQPAILRRMSPGFSLHQCCLVLSCLVLSCLVLSCLLLSCHGLVLSCLFSSSLFFTLLHSSSFSQHKGHTSVTWCRHAGCGTTDQEAGAAQVQPVRPVPAVQGQQQTAHDPKRPVGPPRATCRPPQNQVGAQSTFSPP